MTRGNSSARWHASVFLLVLFLVLAPQSRSQNSASVAQTNLSYLAENAQSIVRGNVVSAVVEPHPQFANLQTVVVTIAVAKTLKGQASATMSFRQFVWNVRDVTGVSGYHKSQELLLFLNPTSIYGMTSPVGMEQGRFRVLRDNRGNRYAVNGRGNVGLFTDVLTKSTLRGVPFSAQAKTMLLKSGGQVSLDALEETIQALVAERP